MIFRPWYARVLRTQRLVLEQRENCMSAPHWKTVFTGGPGCKDLTDNGSSKFVTDVAAESALTLSFVQGRYLTRPWRATECRFVEKKPLIPFW